MPDKEKKRVQWTTFITDDDGMTARDWLIVVSTAVYFTFLAIGLTMLLFGRPLDPMYLALLDSTMPVVITVVGGVMGVQAVETFKRPAKQVRVEEKYEYDDGDPYMPPPPPQQFNGFNDYSDI
jgi:hypothetical protein